MRHQPRHALRVATAVAVMLGATGIAPATAQTRPRMTLCSNPRTRVVRTASKGRCARHERRVVVGRGPRGVTGPRGKRGATGPTGPAGATGSPGVNAFHMVSQDSTLASGSVTVICAPDEVVTGGGANAPSAVLKGSAPTAAGDGWTISVTGNSGTITVTAICVAGTMS